MNKQDKRYWEYIIITYLAIWTAVVLITAFYRGL